jgi:glycosyl transferase, family 25
MSQTVGKLFEYFDRVAIIHLPERGDRLAALKNELRQVGLDMESDKVVIPPAPKPDEANGFPSRGVYGNFLSHINIIHDAVNDDLDTVLILEDDAIFSRAFNAKQALLADCLKVNPWDEFFIGHSVLTGLPETPSGIVRFSGGFRWAHCYALHRRIMRRLVDYFFATINYESGDLRGGKMYIDGAHTLFREFNSDVICLLAAPCLSVQRGSRSNLSSPRWYDRYAALQYGVSAARIARDQMWRLGLVRPKGGAELATITSAAPWPVTLSPPIVDTKADLKRR